MQKGFSSAPIILVALLIVGSYLFSSTLPYKTRIQNSDKYELDDTSTTSQKDSLQMNSLKFKSSNLTPAVSSMPDNPNLPPSLPISTPTAQPGTSACQVNSGKTIPEPVTCMCPYWLVKCVNNKCEKFDYEHQKGDPFRPCSDMDFYQMCQMHATEGDGWYCIDKPVIYLYPLSPMLITTKVITSGEIYVSDPQIEYGMNNKVGGLVSHASENQNEPNRKEGGWTNVLAFPDGTLYYKNKNYRELFYESKTKDIKRPEKGIIIDKTNLRSELLKFITQLGLTRKDEQDEFMDWWMPQLLELPTDKIFVSILERDEKQRLDKVMITPKPDTFIEFIVYFAPLKDHESVNPLVLPPTPERKGFTAVEWGGVIAR